MHHPITSEPDLSRLSPPAYDDMTAEQKAVHDTIVSGPRGSVRGPFLAWIANPEMADRAQKLGEYFRFNTSISRDLAEIAILVTGAHYQAEFEWWAHSQMARDAGVDDTAIEAIRKGEKPSFSDPQADAVFHVAHALNHRHRLTDQEFASAREVLGEQGLVDVIGLCGYYALVSLTLNAYDVPTPDGSAAF